MPPQWRALRSQIKHVSGPKSRMKCKFKMKSRQKKVHKRNSWNPSRSISMRVTIHIGLPRDTPKKQDPRCHARGRAKQTTALFLPKKFQSIQKPQPYLFIPCRLHEQPCRGMFFKGKPRRSVNSHVSIHAWKGATANKHMPPDTTQGIDKFIVES